MPYGLKDEEFNKIQNKIAKKLYEVPSLDRAAFLVECTEQELREAMTELRKTPKSRGKIEAVESEVRKWKKQRDIKEYAQRAARQCGFARVFSWRWGLMLEVAPARIVKHFYI